MTSLKKRISLFAAAGILLFAGGCTQPESKNGSTLTPEEKSRREAFDLAEKNTAVLLTRFDSLDFEIFSNQKWDELRKSHDENITVYWPDGHKTEGLAKHIEDLKGLFVYAPDTRIKEHPIKFGSGEWTCVTGVFEGTFTKPMPMGEDKTIKPTGKKFSLPMCTVGRWKNGVMTEEHLYWDNLTFMKQLGIMQ